MPHQTAIVKTTGCLTASCALSMYLDAQPGAYNPNPRMIASVVLLGVIESAIPRFIAQEANIRNCQAIIISSLCKSKRILVDHPGYKGFNGSLIFECRLCDTGFVRHRFCAIAVLPTPRTPVVVRCAMMGNIQKPAAFIAVVLQ